MPFQTEYYIQLISDRYTDISCRLLSLRERIQDYPENSHTRRKCVHVYLSGSDTSRWTLHPLRSFTAPFEAATITGTDQILDAQEAFPCSGTYFVYTDAPQSY